MGLSLTELGVGIVGACVSIALIVWLARGRRCMTGRLGGGIVLVLALLVTASAATGFLGYVLPVGQMDFWLANLLRGS